MDVQVFGTKKSAETRKALRFFAERRVRTHFVDLTDVKRGDFLTGLDAKRPHKEGAGHAFERIKALTVYGYFTSEPVQVNILKTQMFFNGYDGNVPFTPRV
jgi:hypothetical protein